MSGSYFGALLRSSAALRTERAPRGLRFDHRRRWRRFGRRPGDRDSGSWRCRRRSVARVPSRYFWRDPLIINCSTGRSL